jgi:hypothetical protein
MDKLETSPLAALRHAHTELLADLRDLEHLASSPGGVDPPRLAERLARAREDVLQHFEFEEQNGYMAMVLRRQPHLERVVEHLRDEHRQLAAGLDTLIGQVRAGEADLANKVRTWVSEIRRHEVRENNLVQDAFNVDISAAD